MRSPRRSDQSTAIPRRVQADHRRRGRTSHGPTRKLDLSPVRDRLGEHWPRYEHGVYQITERVIRDAAGADDTWSRTDDVYTICFAGSEARAATVLRRIDESLTELFFGNSLVAEPPNPRTVLGPSGPQSKKKVGRFARMLRHLRALLRFGGPAQSQTSEAAPLTMGAPDSFEGRSTIGTRSPVFRTGGVPAAGSPSHLPPAPSNRATPPPSQAANAIHNMTASSAQQPDTASAQLSARAAGPSGLRNDPPAFCRPDHRDTDEARKMEEAIIDATLRFARENMTDSEAVESLLRNVRFGYRPLWNPQNGLLVAYRYTPYVQDGVQVWEGEAVLPRAYPDEAKAMLDELTIPNVIFDIEAMIRDGRPSIIIVPLHYASFANEWSATQLINLCWHIPKEGRQYVIFDIVDATEGRADHRLRTAVRQLRPFCKLVGATLALQRQEMHLWREVGFRSVIVNLSDAARPEDELFAELDRFHMAARREGLLPIVHGLQSRSLLLAAATMGFHLVHGQAIPNTAYVGKLERIPFAVPDLYADLAKQGGGSAVWEV